MKLEILPDAAAAALRAAAIVAEAARAASAAGRPFTLAVSGGHTPAAMFAALAREDVPWEAVHLFQVDERAAPPGHRDRNWTALDEALLDRVPIAPERLHPMPVEDPDLAAAAARYAATLRAVAGSPPALDLVHLGLGDDGHTASLFPGDPALDVRDADVAATAAHRGHRRLTLTIPILDRASTRLWLVTGADKAPALAHLRAGDRTLPAARLRRTGSLLIADRAAAGTTRARPHRI